MAALTEQEEFEFRKRAEDEAAQHTPSPKVSPLESAVRGAAQGATLDFADEATGAGEAVADVLTGKEKLQNLVDAYRRHRDESRVNYEKARAANPLTYGSSEVAGAVASPVSKVMGGLKGAAVVGGLFGLGKNNADLMDPSLKNYGSAATDAAMGAGAGAIGHKIAGAILPKVRKAARWGADTAGEVHLGTDDVDAVRAAYDSGSIKPLETVRSTSKNLEAAINKSGESFTESPYRDLLNAYEAAKAKTMDKGFKFTDLIPKNIVSNFTKGRFDSTVGAGLNATSNAIDHSRDAIVDATLRGTMSLKQRQQIFQEQK